MNDSIKTDKVILDEIKELVIKINYHDHLYYNENKQKISDAEYDALRKDLENLETQYPHLMLPESPKKLVVQSVKNLKHMHNTPMLSLNNGYSEEEVKAFFLSLIKYLMILKF